MTVEKGNGDARDQFPVGLRVLAVDDDPTCLLLLEKLLRCCQYHVTTTNQAITALKMLRENKNRFDLVISDVHMPDMDGFKLLELVGLEMDLPVIMLSANSDSKLVMKGITHGACDYLLKPVRIEELKNIWQHVIRRRKYDKSDRTNVDNQDRPHSGTADATSDQKLSNNKKRKDQDEDEEDDRDENGHENDDPTTQKKPRVVWSVELHRKFVAAVNQLGVDKAVPKKILDLMNVEKLTRENVASHLQKYRLYLKRISTVANQQANLVAALGSADGSYLQMNTMNGVGLHNLAGHGQFQNTPFRTLPPGGMLGRLNSPAGLGMRGLPSPAVIPLGHAPMTGPAAINQSHFQPTINPGNSGNVLQGIQMSLELDQLQTNKGVSYIREVPNHIDDTAAFPVSSGFSDAKISVGSSNGPFLGVHNKPLMLGADCGGAQGAQKFGKQPSVGLASIESGISSYFPDRGRCDGIWSTTVVSTGVQSNAFAVGECFKQSSLHPGDVRDSMSAMALQSRGNLSDVSSISSLSTHLEDSKNDVQCQVASNNGNHGHIIQSDCPGWDDSRLDATYNSNAVCSSINTAIPLGGIGSPIGRSLDSNNGTFHRTDSFNSSGLSNFFDPSLVNHNDIAHSAMDTLLRSKEAYMVGQQKLQGSYAPNNFGSLEDMVSVMVKREEDQLKFTEGEFGSGTYPLRTCI